MYINSNLNSCINSSNNAHHHQGQHEHHTAMLAAQTLSLVSGRSAFHTVPNRSQSGANLLGVSSVIQQSPNQMQVP